MAFTASTVWEVESGGDDTNFGGGFDIGVAGFPTDGAITLATTSAPVIASASYTFVSADVTTPPAWVYLKSGSSLIPGWYKVTALSGNSAVLDAAIGHAVLANGTPNTVVGCGTTGTLGTITWGIDYSQSTAARINLDDMVVGGTTTQFTSVHTPVAKNFIGNIISVTSGATVQRVTIVSTATTTATCDKTLGTAAQVGVGKLGGAFASPGAAAALRVAGNTTWMKSATYSITSASTNIAGGCVSDAVGGAVRTWEGYSTVRGDLGTPPILQASGISTFTLFAITSGATAGSLLRNFTVDGANLTAGTGLSNSRTNNTFYKVGVKQCSAAAIPSANNAIWISCYATTSLTGWSGAGGGLFFGCEAYSNTGTGFGCTGACDYTDCLGYSNSGASTDGFLISSVGGATNCNAYANGRDGFRANSATSGACVNCIAESNTGFGYSGGGSARPTWVLVNCAAFSNSGGNVDTANVTGPINPAVAIGVSSFFVSAAGGNFALNTTTGAGAAARAAGIPGVFPAGTTTGFLDIGAAQHADPVVTIATRANPLGGFIS